MAITQRDVKLVYDDPPDQVVTTPQGTSLSAPIGSGIPFFQGVTNPQPGLIRTFDQGPTNVLLGTTIAGEKTSQGLGLPYRKHSWLQTGGTNSSGAIQMHWFPGMPEQWSPVWIDEVAFPASSHFKITYDVLQTNPMDSNGSSIKLLRIRSGDAGSQHLIGTLLSKGGPAGANNYHDYSFTFEDLAVGVTGPLSGVQVVADGTFHEYEIELDYSDYEAMVFILRVDGVIIFQAVRRVQNTGYRIDPNAPLFFSPIAEMYSGVTGPDMNTGDFIVDNFVYTAL